ncbi:MAG: IclR family transcriptional regulator [Phycisphaerae bacterium]|nr:IclR family transcriptional regulator [Phycisphaerae bacterium]
MSGKVTKARKPRVVKRVQSVERAMQIVDLLAKAPRGLSLWDLSEAMSLAPQTVQSILRTLQALEIVSQAGRRRPYHLGPYLPRLARTWSGMQDRGELAREIVTKLSGELGENVVLAELRGSHLYRLVEVRADRPLSVRSEDQFSSYVHALATGKVLLAHLGQEDLDDLFGRLAFERLTDKTIVLPEALRRELERVREQGFAESIEEVALGIAAFAVPVEDADGGISAALGTAMPMARLSERRQAEVLGRLRQEAIRISRIWGGDVDGTRRISRNPN